MALSLTELINVALVLFGAGLVCLYRREITEALTEVLRNFWGGGPRPPSHSLPACDGRRALSLYLLLLRRRVPALKAAPEEFQSRWAPAKGDISTLP